jgi:hypothetical protein
MAGGLWRRIAAIVGTGGLVVAITGVGLWLRWGHCGARFDPATSVLVRVEASRAPEYETCLRNRLRAAPPACGRAPAVECVEVEYDSGAALLRLRIRPSPAWNAMSEDAAQHAIGQLRNALDACSVPVTGGVWCAPGGRERSTCEPYPITG